MKVLPANPSKQLAPAFEFTVPKTIHSFMPYNQKKTAFESRLSSNSARPLSSAHKQSPDLVIHRQHMPSQHKVNTHQAKRRTLRVGAPKSASTLRQMNIALTTMANSVPGRISKATKHKSLPIMEAHHRKQLAPSPAFHSPTTSSPLAQPPSTNSSESSTNHEQNLLKFCASSAQAMGKYIMARRAMSYTSSSPKVCSYSLSYKHL